MSFPPGSTFGAYEIVSLLGVGGMGEVYRARDKKLGRDVAIKVLPDITSGDRETRARFEREALLLASLNHPNIAHIYGYEEVDGRGAIVLELVEGVTLSDRLREGALPISEVVAIALQITRALEAAHERGVVHRDLKPANIRIRPDGTVKVLDFGIAKLLNPTDEKAQRDLALSPTITAEGTKAGMIMGTGAYMSPEQARGGVVDTRTDIWSFGCVLFEMLTGQQSFQGDTLSDTIAVILKGDPDFNALPAATPPSVRRLLRRSLTKDARERLHAIADARLELQDTASADAISTPIVTRRSRPVMPIAGVIALAIVAVAVTWRTASRIQPAAPVETTRFAVSIPGDQNLIGFWMIDVSPDGRKVVYTANGRLYVRSLDSLIATPLTDAMTFADAPVFSPDGQSIVYSTRPVAANASKIELRRVSIAGGNPTTICEVPGFVAGLRWVGDRILFGMADGPIHGIFEAPAAGGVARPLVEAHGTEGMSNPDLLADGDTLVFQFRGSSDVTGLVAQSLKTGQRREILPNVRFGRVLSTGHVLYVRGTNLSVQPINLSTLESTGGATTIADNLQSNGSFAYAANVAVSASGSLVYLTAPGQLRRPVWLDRRDGRETPLDVEAKAYIYPTISPDGTHVAFTVHDASYSDWSWSISGQTMIRVTPEAEDPRYAIWTADSKRVMYSVTAQARNRTLISRLADGSGAAEEISPTEGNRYPLTASPDGRFLLFKEGPAGQFSLKSLSLGADHTIKTLVEFKGQSINTAEISSDGRWLVYHEGDARSGNIVVRPFPDVDGGQWLVSQGGMKPLWAKNGRELFFLTPDNSHIAAVPIGSGATFSFGRAVEIADVRRFTLFLPTTSGDVGRTYDVSPDGQRFLVFAPVDSTREQIVVVEHWTNELRK